MAGTQIRVDLKDVSRKLGMLVESLRQALRVAIAGRLEVVARTAFASETSPEGTPWQPLTLGYALAKANSKYGRQGILRRTGTLMDTIFHGTEGNFAFVSTAPLPYAVIHQYGGQTSAHEIVAKEGGFLRFFFSSATFASVKDPIFRRRVKHPGSKIPARPFLPSPETAEREGRDEAELQIKDALEKSGLE